MRTKIIFWFSLLLIVNVACRSKSGKQQSTEKQDSQSIKIEPGNIISGKVISVLDGDTYDILIKGDTTIRVRMNGIDAPERGMPFSNISKKYLSGLCFGKQVTIEITGIDVYNRILAFTYLDDGRELSHEMIKAGLAWHFKRYSSDSILANLEIEARKLKKGLWVQKNPMAPWDNRRYHRQKISTKDSFNIREDER